MPTPALQAAVAALRRTLLAVEGVAAEYEVDDVRTNITVIRGRREQSASPATDHDALHRTETHQFLIDPAAIAVEPVRGHRIIVDELVYEVIDNPAGFNNSDPHGEMIRVYTTLIGPDA